MMHTAMNKNIQFSDPLPSVRLLVEIRVCKRYQDTFSLQANNLSHFELQPVQPKRTRKSRESRLTMPPSAKYLVFVASFSLGICDAFVTPRAFATTSSVAITAQNAHPIDVLLDPISSMSSTTSSLILLSDETVDALADVDTASLLSGLRTFFVVITALVFGLFGITYIIAAFIVPKAAEQLEADTRRLRPGLWEEYEAKLEPGQTMATRPDILQELGDVMRPIIIADFEESARREEEAKKSGVDAVVEKKEDNSIGESPPGTRLDTNDQWKD